MRRPRPRRNPEGHSGISPTPDEVVRSTEIAIVQQLQEQIEEAMKDGAVSRDQLAAGLGLTRAMVDHVLDAPGATLRDLAAFAAVLGVSFRISRYKSGS